MEQSARKQDRDKRRKREGQRPHPTECVDHVKKVSFTRSKLRSLKDSINIICILKFDSGWCRVGLDLGLKEC